MPVATRTRRRQSPTELAVTKRLYAHQAKFPKNAEVEYTRRLARGNRFTSYIGIDDDEDEEVEGDDAELDDVEDIAPQTRTTVCGKIEKVVESKAGKIFKNMATELHQLIAEHLPTDRDVASYALICKTTGDAVTQSLWRKRFLRTFDFDDDLKTEEMLLKYKYRRMVSRHWTCFDLERFGGGANCSYEVKEVQKMNRKHCLDMLRGLIIESNARMVRDDNGNLVIHGLNLQFIQDMITGENGMSYVDIIDSTFSTSYDKQIAKQGTLSSIMKDSDPGVALYVVQLCLAAFSLHPQYSNVKVSHFDISQSQVYAAPLSQPIFTDKWKQSTNTRWLLHVVNFFKYHFKADGEGLLAHEYADLDADQYPQPWMGKIQTGTQPLGTHWKGAYMYLDHDTLLSCRSWKPSQAAFHTDSLDGGETFQDMSFFFDDEQYSKDKWPTVWENILCSDPFKDLDNNTPRQRSSPRSKRNEQERPEIQQFWGTSHGFKQGHFFGRIHALVPQAGIHGFQRLAMMKFYTKLEGDQHVYDPNQVWAYEGCVLPGGRIVVGRWWDAGGVVDDDRINSGPFMWWNVDRSGAANPIGKKEAFDFLESFQDHDVGVF